jgi:hypothetical protein
MPRIMSSDNVEDIPDVFLYLAKSDNATDRICFKRIKAIDLLDVGEKQPKFDIKNYLFEEDKAYDALDDEEFPGILQCRIKLYSKDPDPSEPDDMLEPKDYFLPLDEHYTEFLLQIHLYIGRNFPAADESGAADPFIIARC